MKYNFKDKACEAAGVPSLRVKVQEKYDVQGLAQTIRHLIASKDATSDNNSNSLKTPSHTDPTP